MKRTITSGTQEGRRIRKAEALSSGRSFRKLNDPTIGDSFPLPNITEILDQLGNAKYFTTLDLAQDIIRYRWPRRINRRQPFQRPTGITNIIECRLD